MLRAGDEPIPSYRLEKFLGRGTFGEVWRSTSPGKTSVALKFLDLSGKAGWREFRSIQLVKQIRHAHLMPITALWLLDDQARILDDESMDTLVDEHLPETDGSDGQSSPGAAHESHKPGRDGEDGQAPSDQRASETQGDGRSVTQTMVPGSFDDEDEGADLAAPTESAASSPAGSETINPSDTARPEDQLSQTDPRSRQTAVPGATHVARADEADRRGSGARPRWLVIGQLLGDKTLSDELSAYKASGQPGVPVPQLIRYMEEAAKGIDFLNSRKHDLGNGPVAVQHCDIKPDNILLVGDSVLICDFGVTRVLAEVDLSVTATSMPGSPAYMAPECIAKKPSSASDQYSLAITYYELRTGELPFHSQSYLDVMDAHRSGKLNLTALDGEEQAVIRKATSVDPLDRYPSAVAMVDALRQANAEAGAIPTGRIGKWPMAAAFATLLVASYMVWSRSNDQPAGVSQRTVSIRVEPADAVVTVDNENRPLDADGQLNFLADPEAILEITVQKRPDFKDRNATVPVGNLDPTTPLLIQLEPNAAYHSDQAFALLAEGNFQDAVNTLAHAISLESSLARFPPAKYYQQVRDTSLDAITSLGMSADGRFLVAGGRGRAVRVWDRTEHRGVAGRLIYQHENPVDVVAVGTRLAATGDYSGHVAVHDLATGAQLTRLTLGADILQLALTSDDAVLFTASTDDAGAYLIRQWALDGQQPAAEPVNRLQHPLTVELITVSNPPYVVTADWSGRISKFSRNGDEAVVELFAQTPNDAEIMGMAFAGSAAQRLVIAGGGQTAPDETDSYRLVTFPFDATPPAQVRVFASGHSTAIEVIAASRDGRYVASGGDDGTVQVWQVDASGETERCIIRQKQHVSRVGCLAFAPDSTALVSAGDDGRLMFWDLEASQRFAAKIGQHQGTIVRVLITDDGEVISAGDDVGTIQTRRLDQCRLIKKAAEQANQEPVAPDQAEDATEA